MALSCSGERGEEEAHAEGVVDITEGVDEGGVPAIYRSTSETVQFDMRLFQSHFFKRNKRLSCHCLDGEIENILFDTEKNLSSSTTPSKVESGE